MTSPLNSTSKYSFFVYDDIDFVSVKSKSFAIRDLELRTLSNSKLSSHLIRSDEGDNYNLLNFAALFMRIAKILVSSSSLGENCPKLCGYFFFSFSANTKKVMKPPQKLFRRSKTSWKQSCWSRRITSCMGKESFTLINSLIFRTKNGKESAMAIVQDVRKSREGKLQLLSREYQLASQRSNHASKGSRILLQLLLVFLRYCGTRSPLV